MQNRDAGAKLYYPMDRFRFEWLEFGYFSLVSFDSVPDLRRFVDLCQFMYEWLDFVFVF
jgi:hypothetical protein